MKGEVLSEVGLHLNTADNVITAIDDVKEGAIVTYGGEQIELSEDIPFGHKIALEQFEVGDNVIKYGEVIGEVTEPVSAGAWIHTHNTESLRGRGDVSVSEGEA
ncbi:MAG: Altronate dehydratase [Haloquadratum sp. J07HQX50]|nr:MAG: Altronate dehydratase [Haloquadratum sp. J07HQX50]